MKTKYLYLIAIAATLAAGCKKEEKPLSPSEQQDTLEGIGIELVEYADVEKWGESFKAVAKFEEAVSSKDNDQSVFEALANSVETTEERGSESDDTNYGWFCNYQAPGEFVYERINTVQFDNIKGSFTLDASKKAWVKTDAPTLTITADVDGAQMTAETAIKASSTPTLITESRDEYYNEWPAYTTGPAMYLNKVQYQGDGYDYYNWEPVTRQNGNATEYHFYNPVTNEDYGWYDDSKIYGNYDAFTNMVSVPAGRHTKVRVQKNYISIPESITAKIRKGNETIADLSIGIGYKPATAGKLDISKDQANVEFAFSAAGYTLKTKKLDYLSDGAEASYVFSYGKKDIFTMTVKESGFKLTSEEKQDKNDYDNGDGYKNGSCYTHTSYEVSSMPKSAEISFDLLGELQIKGTANIEKLVQCSEKMDEARTSEVEFKSWLGQAEQAMTLQVFYDSKKCSAHLGLEPEKNQAGEWTVIPVIRFDDGSAYAMFESFFNETDFADLIKAIEEWQKSVDSYLSSVLNKK